MQIYFLPSSLNQTRLAYIREFLTAQDIEFSQQIITQKPNQKWLKSIAEPSLLLDDSGTLFLVADGMKVSPNWLSLQQRVVKAGKKSELLLKAAKLQPDMQVIDATAGFGHDSLILASTGAKITMIEQNPIMYLLLTAELASMQNNPNWQKLLSRLTLQLGDFRKLYMGEKRPLVDMVFLDPMFPENSYKSAQVNKNMQLLHTLAPPPTSDDEIALIQQAKNCLNSQGKLIIKRPIQAPLLANMAPNDSVSNDIIRFDIYLQHA